MDLTALTLFGRARYQVLACLFALRPEGSIHLREIARRTGLSPTATQYELRLLLQTDLVLQEGADRRLTYRINKRHHIERELRSMVRKLDAWKEAGVIEDDAYWSRKRVRQQADYQSNSLKRKSPFLSNRQLAPTLKADIGKDASYDY